jgi:hypothetical protein
LIQGQWTPLVRDYREEVLAAARRTFEQGLGQIDAGLDLPSGVPELARRAGIDLRQTMVHALAKAASVPWPKTTTVPVDMAQIPLRRSVLDVVAFRSLDRVRERVFGTMQKPDVKIPGKEKAARIGEAGRLHLHQCVTQFRGQLLPETVAILREHFGPRLAGHAIEALRAQLAVHAPRLQQKRADLVAHREQLLRLATPLRALAAAGKGLVPKLAELGRAFDHEIANAPHKQVVLAPQPPPAPRQRDGRPAASPPARKT